jgi:taurine dioxygenase
MSIEVIPVAGALGAEIRGVNLAKASDSDIAEIQQGFHDHGVVFFRDQDLTVDGELSFARHFGEPDVHPIANGMETHPEVIAVRKPAGEDAFFGTSWHTDNSFFECPSAITILYGVEIPPYGGDTVFASMEGAYERLSEPMKRFLDPLVAVHSAGAAFDPRTTGDAKYRGETAISYRYSDEIFDEVEHPVVRTHPVTGRKSIYVNAMFTQRIVGLESHESDALLEMLYAHATRHELTCRFAWQPGSLAMWDNRCVQHYAINDYRDFERTLYRVTITGSRPS